MKVRRAEIKDSGRIMELLRQVNNVHHVNRPDLFLKDKTKYTEEELLKIIQDDQTPIFVALDEDELVLGYSFGVFQSHVDDNNFPDIVSYYIDDICVDEKCRRQHVGQALYDYTIAFARESGCYNVTLNVWEKNDSARIFYEQCGFKPQKTCMEVIL
ncbi:MAG: GNAT family N-acetyltransferase [Eubacterium sp.]|nr:GNAT family N-acetyltransferase [Eubacterium sp.]